VAEFKKLEAELLSIKGFAVCVKAAEVFTEPILLKLEL
jgi:hypothetical protein